MIRTAAVSSAPTASRIAEKMLTLMYWIILAQATKDYLGRKSSLMMPTAIVASVCSESTSVVVLCSVLFVCELVCSLLFTFLFLFCLQVTEKTITPEISKKKPFSPTTSCRAVVLTGHLKLTTPLTPLTRIAKVLSNPTSYQACDGTINFANYMTS